MKPFELIVLISVLLCTFFAMTLFFSCGDDDDDNDDNTIADDDETEDDDDMTDDDDSDDDDSDDDDTIDDDDTDADDDDTDDDTTDDDDTIDDDDTGDDDDTVAPTWDNFAQQFFSDYCTRCHASTLTGLNRNFAPVGVDYDTYALAVTNAAGAKTRAADSTGMPLGNPKPATGERATLGEWVDNGTPEN